MILSLVGWTGLARVVRSKLLALREEDFATPPIPIPGSGRRYANSIRACSPGARASLSSPVTSGMDSASASAT